MHIKKTVFSQHNTNIQEEQRLHVLYKMVAKWFLAETCSFFSSSYINVVLTGCKIHFYVITQRV